jgi:hypothetical protein
MQNLGEKIRSVPVRTDPYPYFVIDDFLDGATLENIKELWPNGPLDAEAPGNYLIYLGTRDGRAMRAMTVAQRQFWKMFIEKIQDEIIPATVERYFDWIGPRYPGLKSIELDALSLMETDSKFTQHGSHAHHWHDPTWLFTNLIYIDDESSSRGTAIFRISEASGVNDLAHAAQVAANTRHWLREDGWSGNPDLELVTTIENRPNRLFSFYESPISFHGVEPCAPSAAKRRIVRMHIRAPRAYIQRLYGVSHAEYKRRREAAEISDEVIGWMRRDIEDLKAPRQMPCSKLHYPKIRTGATKLESFVVWAMDKAVDRFRAYT